MILLGSKYCIELVAKGTRPPSNDNRSTSVTLTSIAVQEALNSDAPIVPIWWRRVVQMKCEGCGVNSEGEWQSCPNCGQLALEGPTAVGPPGSVGPASANGSDEVRNSRTASPDVTAPGLANPGRPRGQILEGAGG